jgi:hypothetical protein
MYRVWQPDSTLTSLSLLASDDDSDDFAVLIGAKELHKT